MFRFTLRRIWRVPVPALGVLLFAMILSVVLCALEKSNIEEQRRYEETFNTIPVTFTVTNLSGTKNMNLSIPYVFIYPFEPGGCLAPYVSDLQVLTKRHAQNGTCLAGITSTALPPEISAEAGSPITWKDGYDGTIFTGEEELALIPEDMVTQIDEETGEEYIELFFRESKTTSEGLEYRECNCRLRVAGTYTDSHKKGTVFCPYEVSVQVSYKLVQGIQFDAIRATLANNYDLEALRAAAWEWFALPNALGEKTLWEKPQYGYEHYPFALDIDDTLLQQVTATLRNSIATNRICTVLVLCLAAGAGLLIGFLMVRSRKREIALLRTMGTPPASIFCGFAAEQLLCFCLGIALGGASNGWQPLAQLGILLLLFVIGLTAALLVFLRNNLMISIKEEE